MEISLTQKRNIYQKRDNILIMQFFQMQPLCSLLCCSYTRFFFIHMRLSSALLFPFLFSLLVRTLGCSLPGGDNVCLFIWFLTCYARTMTVVSEKKVNH